MVTIIRPEPPSKTDWVADRRYYLDKNGNVVGEKDPARVSLLIAAGCTMPIERARSFGLVKDAEPEPAPVLSVVEKPVVVEPAPVIHPRSVIEPPKAVAEAKPAKPAAVAPKPETKPVKKAAKKSKK